MNLHLLKGNILVMALLLLGLKKVLKQSLGSTAAQLVCDSTGKKGVTRSQVLEEGFHWVPLPTPGGSHLSHLQTDTTASAAGSKFDPSPTQGRAHRAGWNPCVPVEGLKAILQEKARY